MSYNPFEEANKTPVLELLDKLQIEYTKNGAGYVLKAKDGKKDMSFSICPKRNIITDFGSSGIKGGPVDFVGQYYLNISESEMRTDVGRATTIKFFIDKGIINPPEGNNKTFTPSLTSKQLLEQFNDFKLGGYKSDISSFLMKRGFTHDWINKNKLKVGEIFCDIGFYENYFTTEKAVWQDDDGKWHNEQGDEPKTVAVFMFPCFDENAELIGLKLRRKDGKTIRGKKSLAIGKTGLLYDGVDLDKMVLVEGEMDYLVLRLLGYNNVIANLGGVQSGRQMMKSLLAETKSIICLYDNDTAGSNGKLALQETFKRPIMEIEYPVRKDTNGKDLSDVNDYFEVGYDTKAKWDNILSTAKNLGSNDKGKDRTPFVFLRSNLEYYDTEEKKIQQTSSVAAFLGATNKELAKMVLDNIIKTYKDLCYHEGGKEGYYNTMNEEVIMKHGGDAEPKIHPHIETLINNICGGRQAEIEWLHQSILYKLSHINDPYMPALILYGTGGSGKGSLLNLLEQIFGTDNIQTGLGQRDLEGSFDSYQGGKLIVEYKEISSGNKRDDKKILDRIKGMLSERTISVNAKYQNVRQVENKARFHFSSNHALPIQLDSKHSGNRRFTIIKTGGALDATFARELNEVTIRNKQVIREYVAWLYETYPEIPKLSSFVALNNNTKKELENSCEGVANIFFEWFERKYPSITKITNKEKNMLLELHCDEVGEDIKDIKYKQSNFDLGLSHRYEKKTVRINGKNVRGYYVNKTDFDKEHIDPNKKSEFDPGEVDKMLQVWNNNNSLY